MGPYLYIKALHLVAVVSWFAGLLYIVRLFIYHVEAAARPEAERAVLQAQFAIMERRLWYGITWPAFIATAVFGIWLMILRPRLRAHWFHLQARPAGPADRVPSLLRKDPQRPGAGVCRLTSKQLRIWNEAATLLLFAIVFTAV